MAQIDEEKFDLVKIKDVISRLNGIREVGIVNAKEDKRTIEDALQVLVDLMCELM